jgi:hypothetical protein
MSKLLLLAVLLYACTAVSAQPAQPGAHSYYIEIKGVDTKTKNEALSGLIRSKPGVTVFNQYRAARPFFVLRSGMPVSKEVFSGWIKTLGLELAGFEAKEITAAFLKARRLERKPGQKADVPAKKH